MHDEFEMSMMGELNFFLGLQMKDGIFFNQSKYIKEMLKKFSLEEPKPMKTTMSSDTKLTKDEERESVDSKKYRGMIGSLLYLTASRPDSMFNVCLCSHLQEAPKTSHLGLWYPKGHKIKRVVYADSDHTGDYVDRKRTSSICTFVGCCLTSWVSKKQTTLAISTIEAEYVSTEMACQQALWMKQDIIDYDVRLDDVPIMCDNKGAIDLSKTRESSELLNESCVLYDHVMNAFIAHQERKTIKDHGTRRGCHFTSSSSAFDQPSSSHLNDDDVRNGEGTSLVPPRPSNPQPLQSHPSLDITLSLSPITPFDHILDTPSPPLPQPQPPLMGHPIYFNYHDYHGSTCLCCFYNRNLIFSLRDEMNLMFAHIEYLLTSTMNSLSSCHP
uniref:Reverse transcriptase Ty1/copia-type domain-containing protein n=1 Tax=Tanacetum cinerariifolium TaxID=118510 RepID=A0A6L2L6V4_TANCI|nr:hypothetical protein [Tanacetum cinerariifolium]